MTKREIAGLALVFVLALAFGLWRVEWARELDRVWLHGEVVGVTDDGRQIVEVDGRIVLVRR